MYATLIPILPFVMLGNHWSPGKVTWANPRLGKVTLNRARLHIRKSTAWPRSRRYTIETCTTIFHFCNKNSAYYFYNEHNILIFDQVYKRNKKDFFLFFMPNQAPSKYWFNQSSHIMEFRNIEAYIYIR